jgi:hypothetical protein
MMTKKKATGARKHKEESLEIDYGMYWDKKAEVR